MAGRQEREGPMGELRDRMEADLRLRGYAEKTRVAYVSCVRAFARHFRRSPAALGEDEVRAYLTYLGDVRRVRPATQVVHAAALRFLYRITLHQPELAARVPRLRRPQTLPAVLSVEEVGQVLGAITAPKYRALFLVRSGTASPPISSRPAPSSCRNRHCPKCEALREARWIEARMARLVPSHYFHVVFTLPATLRPLVLRNRRRLFTLLFRAATQTLLTVGRDPARLGARLGVTAVLHTWTRDLQFHPHLHCIVTGGGLALDPPRWIATARRHLFPVRVLSRLFRGKFLAALARAYAAGHLDLAGGCTPLADPHAFARFKHRPYRRDWIVYAKRPFAGPRQLFRYLARYTHRLRP